MALELVPLLHVQRALYDIPPGPDRFQAYVATMVGDGGEDGRPPDLVPLVAMNPMGKPHVVAVLDALIALDAEEVAAGAVAEAGQRLPDVPSLGRVGLVVADDVGGGWTNRPFSEMHDRFPERRVGAAGNWLAVLLWASEPPSVAAVREATLATIYRAAYFTRHGPALTLGEMMTQQGLAAVFAGATTSNLDPEELEYTREVLSPHLASAHFPTIFACLYGDEAARSVGYEPLGLSTRAGFALALADARAGGQEPEAVLPEAATW